MYPMKNAGILGITQILTLWCKVDFKYEQWIAMGRMWNLWYSYWGCRFASVLGVTATVLKPCQRRCLRALGAQDPLTLEIATCLPCRRKVWPSEQRWKPNWRPGTIWDCHNIGVKDFSVGPYPLTLMEYHAITWEVVNPFPQELEDEVMQLQNMADPATTWYPVPKLTQPINFRLSKNKLVKNKFTRSPLFARHFLRRLPTWMLKSTRRSWRTHSSCHQCRVV